MSQMKSEKDIRICLNEAVAEYETFIRERKYDSNAYKYEIQFKEEIKVLKWVLGEKE